MPEISRFYGIVIYMFFNDHNPPHFKVKYGEFEANILIENGSILMEIHKDVLYKMWISKEFHKIAPLQ